MRHSGREGGFRHADPLGAPPEPFEGVKGSQLRAEDVDDKVEVIEQNPFRSIVAFNVSWFAVDSCEMVDDRVGDRFDVPRVVTRADHEVIGESCRRTQIQHNQIISLLLTRRVNGLDDMVRQHRL